jgi:F-type H+-transporting ATPase subunit delta
VLRDVLARRYSKAFFESQPSIENSIKTHEDLEAFASLFEESHAMRVIMLSPSFTADEKTAFINQLSEQKGWQEETKSFIQLLAEKNRIRYVKEVVQALGKLIDQAQGRKRVKILTAKPFSEEETRRVRHRMGEITGQEVEMSVDVDPALIGGMVVQIGSRVFDGSVRGKLEALTERLVKGA